MASANAETLANYLAAGTEGLRWVLDPANRAEAVRLAGDRLGVTAYVAAEILAVATDPLDGLAADAAFDLTGFKTVLGLRADFEGRAPAAPEKYLLFHSTAGRLPASERWRVALDKGILTS